MAGRRALLIVLLAAAALPYFVNLGATSIIDANEAFYAETPREMIESGNYISPSFNYEPRLNKPPLSYWVVAAFYRAFGVSLGAARLPIALGAMVIIATAFLVGRQAFSLRAGVIAAVTLAATPRMLLFSRRIIIDVYTTMFVGLTLLCFVLAETDPPRRRRWLVAMYVAAALGVLTKGPVAVAIPGLVFTVYLLATGRVRPVSRLMLPAGAFIGCAIVVPYYVALYAQQGWDAIASFLLVENLARYAEGVGAPDRGPLFYLPVVFTDLYFPWSLLLPAALALVPWRMVRGLFSRARMADGEAAASEGDVRLLLGLWILLIVVVFSLSKGQQDLYVLPFVVAGAPLVGGLADGWMKRAWAPRLDQVTSASLWLVAGACVALGIAGVWLAGPSGSRIHLSGVLPAGLVLAAGGTVALAGLARRARVMPLAALATGLIVVHWTLVAWSLPDFERYKPVPHLARAVRELPAPPSAIGMYRVGTPSLVFYLRRHVTELFDKEQLTAFLTSHPDGVCVMRGEDYDDVRQGTPVPIRIVASAPHFDGKLTDFLGQEPLPTLILVTALRP